ncbi:MAG TPA: MFS transporter [Acidimicrobiales bacterium]|nr:MFS transporter [Acidimicrobiales bacterium]
MSERFSRRHPDFSRLWLGQSISLVGTQVTFVALPLLAITTLHASTLEVGLLAGAETLPFLLIGLPAGVWVDRWRRRPVLVAADAGRGLLLASIPLAYAMGVLHMVQLYVVAFGTGILTVFFDVAYQSYVPGLVAGEALIDANARLEVSYSAAQTLGPGIGGVLVQAVGAATAILIDTISYALSAVVLLTIRADEPKPERHEADAALGMFASVRQGLRYVLRHRLLVRIAACSALYNLFSAMSMAVFLLYAVRDLRVSPATIGLLFSAGGAALVGGTLLMARMGSRLRTGAALSVGALIQGLAFLLVPAAPLSHPVPFFFAAIVLESLFSPAYNITQISLRQTVTPPRLHGRMTATMRFLVWGALPLGSVLGGVLASQVGRHTTLWVSAAGGALSALPVLLGPLRGLKSMPDPEPEASLVG